MNRDDIGDRFKEYESCWDFALPRRLPLVVRVDGRAFHSLTLEKPFDAEFSAAMEGTARALCQEIQGARWAFFQSDEISVIARDDMSLQSQPWLGKRLNKLLSLSAAIATSAFREWWCGQGQFDARAFVLPSLDEVVNYCIWRQQDAARNSVSMLARSVFSHKQCHLKTSDDLIAMLRDVGKPWEDTPERFKRGAIISRVTVEKQVPGTDEVCQRSEWRTDEAPPIFTKEPDYLRSLWSENKKIA